MKKINLDKVRNNIINIDKKIVELLDKRMNEVLLVGKYKKEKNLPIYDPARETRVISNILKQNKTFPAKNLKRIYSEIIAASISLEKLNTIAVFGHEGSFTQLAAISKFGDNNSFINKKSIPEVFKEVESGRAEYGIVPIENSNHGAVTYTLDTLITTPLYISAEIPFNVSQNLLSKAKTIKNIKRIYSHPQSFGQCYKWLKENFGNNVEFIDVESTSEAAKLVAKSKTSAAIGSELAAKIYGLNVLYKNIEDSFENITRFLVIGKAITNPSGNDKTSIAFAIKDKVGALHECLKPFSDNKINLTKIESRPAKNQPWNYIFFIDLEGHITSPKIKNTINLLNPYCSFIKFLGSYPKDC